VVWCSFDSWFSSALSGDYAHLLMYTHDNLISVKGAIMESVDWMIVIGNIFKTIE